RSQAQVGVERARIHHLPRVHAPLRTPEALEGGKPGGELRAVHPSQQLAARLTVPVLPGERAAVRHHEVGRVLDEGAELTDTGRGVQVEGDADVHAAVAEVAVEGGLVA